MKIENFAQRDAGLPLVRCHIEIETEDEIRRQFTIAKVVGSSKREVLAEYGVDFVAITSDEDLFPSQYLNRVNKRR